MDKEDNHQTTGDLGASYCSSSSDDGVRDIAPPGDQQGLDDDKHDHLPRGRSDFLTYHRDMARMDHPEICVPISDQGACLGPQSRRVILDNLSLDATPAQVLKGIRGYGGIVSVLVTRCPSVKRKSAKAALVEFVYPEAAAEYADCVHKRPLIYTARDNVGHSPTAYLVPTPSWFHSQLSRHLLENGVTRSLCLPNFPLDAVWFLICAVGHGSVTSTLLDQENNLTLEFSSLFDAARAARIVRLDHVHIGYGAGKNNVHYRPDSSQGNMEDVYRTTDGVIGYIDSQFLHQAWNKAPYNLYRPGCFSNREPTPPTSRLKQTKDDILAEHFNIDADEVCDFLQEREHFQSTTYKIVGSTISLTRHKYSWSISSKDSIKLLMANTLHHPDWEKNWDTYFHSCGLINLRRWEQYGSMAKHRREVASAQGLKAGTVPLCDGCEWRCQQIKSTPVPGLVKEWCATRPSTEP